MCWEGCHTFTCDPSVAGRGREYCSQHLSSVLDTSEASNYIDDAGLVISELLTNAVNTGCADTQLLINLHHDHARIVSPTTRPAGQRCSVRLPIEITAGVCRSLTTSRGCLGRTHHDHRIRQGSLGRHHNRPAPHRPDRLSYMRPRRDDEKRGRRVSGVMMVGELARLRGGQGGRAQCSGSGLSRAPRS